MQIELKVRSECGSTVGFSLGNATKLKYIKVLSKLCHATLYLLRSHVKKKMVKRFNDPE